MMIGHEIYEEQAKLENLLTDNMPIRKDLFFYHDYALYPEIILEIDQPAKLKPVLESVFIENGFTTDMVELEVVECESFPELRFVFDLKLFNKESAQKFFGLLESHITAA